MNSLFVQHNYPTTELTKKAAMPTLKRCHIAATEAEYLAKLMQKHGGDCKVPYSHTTDRQMHNYTRTRTGMNTEIPYNYM